MKRLHLAVLAFAASTALTACETNYYSTAPAIKPDTAAVATFSPPASAVVTMAPGTYAFDAFSMCITRGTQYAFSVNTDSPAVTPAGYGWSEPTSSSDCSSGYEKVTFDATVYGAALGRANITVIVTLSPTGKEQVTKNLTFVAQVANQP